MTDRTRAKVQFATLQPYIHWLILGYQLNNYLLLFRKNPVNSIPGHRVKQQQVSIELEGGELLLINKVKKYLKIGIVSRAI